MWLRISGIYNIFTKYSTEKDLLCSHNEHQSVNVNSICFVHLMQRTSVYTF